MNKLDKLIKELDNDITKKWNKRHYWKKKSDKKGNLLISEVECLNLIETYLFYKTGQKVGDIQSPTSILKKGIAGRLMG